MHSSEYTPNISPSLNEIHCSKMLFLIEEKLFGLVYMYMYLSMKPWPVIIIVVTCRMWSVKQTSEQFFKNYHYNKFFIIFDLVHLHVYHNNIVFIEILKGYLTVWGGYYCLFISHNLLARFGYFSWISSFKVHMGIYTYLIIVIKFSPSKQTIQNDYQFF